MNNVEKLLLDRHIPELGIGATAEDFERRQQEIRELLAEKQFGAIPREPDHMHVETKTTLENIACGRAVLKRLNFTFEMDSNTFSFPVVSAIPKKKEKVPAFVCLSFERGDAGKYFPTEEIVERGFALFTFCYLDVTSDDNNFKNGIAKYLVDSRRNSNAPGKIALWAWAAMRVMDYVQTLSDVIDLDHVAVIGHSRLGKTALYTGGCDKRFKYVISNDSGCAGAAIELDKVGERYDRISKVFPYWFCPAFNRRAASGKAMPFDQHYLLSLTVPRYLIVGSAFEDVWADPTSEFLGAASLNDAYALYGKRGLIHNDEIPTPRTVLDEGESVYYVREGTHYLSRHDWNTYMDIIDKKRKESI
jgi:hypothetical protein